MSLIGDSAGIRENHRPTLVLYIEDNAANTRLVERVFEHRPNIDLITANCGMLGVELARTRRPSVVLLDLGLPDIEGAEVLARLRADPQTAALPVVIVSADAFNQRIQQLLHAGADAFLTKPIDVHELLRTVDELIVEQTVT